MFEIMKNYMSIEQFMELLFEIMEKHRWSGDLMKSHMIKYVRPHFDTRTAMFFGIELEGMRGKKSFFVVNENTDKNLLEWVREFLNKEPKEAGWDDWNKE